MSFKARVGNGTCHVMSCLVKSSLDTAHVKTNILRHNAENYMGVDLYAHVLIH